MKRAHDGGAAGSAKMSRLAAGAAGACSAPAGHGGAARTAGVSALLSTETLSPIDEQKKKTKKPREWIYEPTVLIANGKYRIVKRLGYGAYAEVYEVVEVATGLGYAAKQWLPCNKCGDDQSFCMKCTNLTSIEFGILAKLARSGYDKYHFVGVRELIHTSEGPLTVMELLGNSLADYLDRGFKHGMAAPYASSIIHHLAISLSYLRDYPGRPVVHCDLKPQNILWNRGSDKTKLWLFIVDFGSAIFSDEAINPMHTTPNQSLIDEGKEHQTLWYRSPEVLLGHSISTASDIWSLGLIALELLKGSPMFTSGDEMAQMARYLETFGFPPHDMLISANPKVRGLYFEPVPTSFSEWRPTKALRRHMKCEPGMNPLEAQISLTSSSSTPEANKQFMALVKSMLDWHPRRRPTAKKIDIILTAASTSSFASATSTSSFASAASTSSSMSAVASASVASSTSVASASIAGSAVSAAVVSGSGSASSAAMVAGSASSAAVVAGSAAMVAGSASSSAARGCDASPTFSPQSVAPSPASVVAAELVAAAAPEFVVTQPSAFALAAHRMALLQQREMNSTPPVDDSGLAGGTSGAGGVVGAGVAGAGVAGAGAGGKSGARLEEVKETKEKKKIMDMKQRQAWIARVFAKASSTISVAADTEATTRKFIFETDAFMAAAASARPRTCGLCGCFVNSSSRWIQLAIERPLKFSALCFQPKCSSVPLVSRKLAVNVWDAGRRLGFIIIADGNVFRCHNLSFERVILQDGGGRAINLHPEITAHRHRLPV